MYNPISLQLSQLECQHPLSYIWNEASELVEALRSRHQVKQYERFPFSTYDIDSKRDGTSEGLNFILRFTFFH